MNVDAKETGLQGLGVRRIALGLSYDGSAFKGWQSQLKPRVDTVQERVELALSKIANTSVRIICAGRTDSGVHASHQVVHFETDVQRPDRAWVQGANAHLPDTVAISWAKIVKDDFHARFSATARRYRYVILNSPTRSAILSNGVTLERRILDAELMHEEAQCLLGEQDFTSFRAVACQSNTPMRNVHFIRVKRLGELVVIDIQANAFLYHMVRNIAGALMDVGAAKYPKGWLREIMAARDRSLSSATASPCGLYLVDVEYPAQFQLPSQPLGPFFLTGL